MRDIYKVLTVEIHYLLKLIEPEAGMFQNQKDHFVSDITQAENTKIWSLNLNNLRPQFVD